MIKEIDVTEYFTENFAELRKQDKSPDSVASRENDKGLTSKEPLKTEQEKPNG